MTAFANFALQITYPPNPIRNLDDSLTAEQQAGHDFYFNKLADGGEAPSDAVPQLQRLPRPRSQRQRRVHRAPGLLRDRRAPLVRGRDADLQGPPPPQRLPEARNVRGIACGLAGPGVGHPAAQRTAGVRRTRRRRARLRLPPRRNHRDHRGVSDRHRLPPGRRADHAASNGALLGPNPTGIPFFNSTTNPFDSTSGISTQGLELRQALASFVLAFDSNMFPIVGQQVTLTAGDASSATARIALFEARAAAGDCDLIVRGQIAGRERGFVLSQGSFVQDRSRAPALSDAALRALVGIADAVADVHVRAARLRLAPRASTATATATRTATSSRRAATPRTPTACPERGRSGTKTTGEGTKVLAACRLCEAPFVVSLEPCEKAVCAAPSAARSTSWMPGEVCRESAR